MGQVTVVVVSYNSRRHLAGCLAAVGGQGGDVRIVVVDNGSSDGSPALVETRFPQVQLVAGSTNLGFAGAVNRGLALAGGRFVMLLNPDVTLLPGALNRLVSFLGTKARAAGVGPRQWVNRDRAWQWSIVPTPPDWRSLLSRRAALQRWGFNRRRMAVHWALNRAIWRRETPRTVPALSGACLLLRRDALQSVGGLDEEFFLFFEDLDLARRLRLAGWSLYALPSTGVVHPGMGSVSALADQGREHLLTSGRRYLKRHGDPLSRFLWTQIGRRQRGKGRCVRTERPDGRADGLDRVLHWPPVVGARGYWVELAPDPTFLYAAAARVPGPACRVPKQVLALAAGRFPWGRVAPIDATGRLGPFVPIPRPGGKEAR